MRFRYFLILVTLILNSSLLSLRSMAEGTGEWKLYPCFNSISQIEPAGDKVYVLSSNNIYSYNVKEGSYETYDKTSGLTDIKINHIAYSQSSKSLIVIYNNSNIDILYSNGDIVNINDLYNKSMTESKVINSVYVNGKYAYVCGEFGIMKVDMKDAYICDTYKMDYNIKAATILGNNIYALTGTTIITAKTTDNLIDKSVWTVAIDMKKSFNDLINIGNKLYIGDKGYVCYVDLTAKTFTGVVPYGYSWSSTSNNEIIWGNGSNIYKLDSSNNYTKYSTPCTFTYMVYDKTNNCYWANDNNGALVKYSIVDTNITAISTGIKPEGPASDYCYRLAMAGDKLIVSAGGWGLVTSQRSLPGEVKCLDDGKWTSYQSTGDIVSAVGRYTDMNAIAVDPRDDTHVFVSSYHGLYEFKSGSFVKYYGLNDGMQTYDDNDAKPYHVIVTDIKYDSNNNLWILNSYTKAPLFCLTSDNKFVHLTKVNNDDKNYFYYSEGITFIDNNLWFVASTYDYNGIYRYDIKNDVFYPCYSFKNEDEEKISIDYIYTLASDKKGNIWIGTNLGPFYITPANYESFVLTQHKVPRNDGTNLADYLLHNVFVYKIVADGANRKWIGTNEGIYVISSDCNTQLYHFTSSNSPLLSNLILDILIDDNTGRVYIATDKGLCSYKGDATEGNENMSSDDVYAYPNPVTPDFTGDITIVGLSAGSDVKIMTAGGEIVNTGTSNGGTYIWNGRNQDGDKVASGVYIVCASTSDGSNGAVAKIAIVR